MIQAEKVKLQEKILEMQFKAEDIHMELEKKASEVKAAELYRQKYEGKHNHLADVQYFTMTLISLIQRRKRSWRRRWQNQRLGWLIPT